MRDQSSSSCYMGKMEDNSRNKARQPSGNEALNEPRGIPWIESTMQDVQLALRALRKSPGFATTAILTLALGIGVNAAIFQLMDALRLRSLPVTDPQALASVQVKGGIRGFGISGNETLITNPLWEQIREHQQAFSGVFAWRGNHLRLGRGVQEKRAPALWVSGDTFATLGVYPIRGRFFSAEDDRPGCGTPGAVISYAFWQREFGGEDSAVGSTVLIEHRLTYVIGVTPPRFFGLEVGRTFDFALPLCAIQSYNPDDGSLTRRDFFSLSVMGRRKPGWTLARASAQLESISPGMIDATVPDGYSSIALNTYRNFRLNAYPAATGVSSLREAYDTSLWLLFAITGLVLLIACANLANLMLARASTRQREMAVRLVLGASRWRLIRQLLAEGALLALIGAVLGTALATGFSRGIVRFLSTADDVLRLDLGLDWRVLAFTGAVAMATCTIFDLVPALRSSRTNPGTALKAGSRGMTAGRERFAFQRILVVSQIAVSTVLLVGALLFVRSFRNLLTFDPGFREDGIVQVFVGLSHLKFPEVAAYDPVMRDVVEHLRSIPGVAALATSTHVLLDGSTWSLGVRVEGSEGFSKFTWVGPDFFQTMGIPLLAGRSFTNRDTRSSPQVVIVNETFVRKYLGARNPVGKILRTVAEPNYPAVECEIVGVARDTKYGSLRDPVPPETFGPGTQFPPGQSVAYVFMRTSLPPAQMIPAARAKLGQFDPDINAEFRVFREGIQNTLVRERMMALLSGSFGALAALLTMVGLYGVISYIIAMRRNEIGIRMALGASRRSVVAIILSQTMRMLALGVASGLLLSLGATRGAASLLFGLQPNDPASLLEATALLVAVAVIAGYVPAWRASRIDPGTALRYE
jgi:putative ABC transport system permease protein